MCVWRPAANLWCPSLESSTLVFETESLTGSPGVLDLARLAGWPGSPGIHLSPPPQLVTTPGFKEWAGNGTQILTKLFLKLKVIYFKIQSNSIFWEEELQTLITEHFRDQRT